MGTATTARTLEGPLVIENGRQQGNFGCLSRDATQSIFVDVAWQDHAETIELAHPGDSCLFALVGVVTITVRAANYPTTVMLLDTVAPITLTSALFLSPA